MNCLDVMSQAFPYQRYHSQSKKYDVARMHDPSPGLYDASPLPLQDTRPLTDPRQLHDARPPLESRYARRSPPSRPVSIKQEDSSEREQPKETRYLTANCVLLTYFSGEISQVVDDHFTRALSQSSSYSPGHDGSDTEKKKESSPMTQRNFPPSFWNSHHHHHNHHHHPTPSTSHDLQFSEPCSSFQLQDPWHYYPLATPSAAAYSSRTMQQMHDFQSYAQMSGRFNGAQYKSALLMNPRNGRFAPSGSSCDLNKPTDTWAARYHADTICPEFTGPHHLESSHLSGLEAAVASTAHDPAKDLYWF